MALPYIHPFFCHPPHHSFWFHVQRTSHLRDAVDQGRVKLAAAAWAFGNGTMRFHNQLRGYFTIFSDDLLFTFHCSPSLSIRFSSNVDHPQTRLFCRG